MFDDEKNPSSAPSNLPFAPDSRSGTPAPSAPAAPSTPNALSAGLLRRKDADAETATPAASAAPAAEGGVPGAPPAQPTMAAMAYATKEPVLGKILATVLTIVLVGGLGFGGWYGYTKILKPLLNKTPGTAPTTTVVSTDTAVPTPQSTSSAVTPLPTTSIRNDINNETILFGEQTDTDADNLSDRREREIGTDEYVADTDQDELADGDEVLIWGTDPRNPDTDGDGHRDGHEILHGYSPLGSGRLLAPPATQPTTSAPMSAPEPTTPVPSL